jgi:hypothetical protein
MRKILDVEVGKMRVHAQRTSEAERSSANTKGRRVVFTDVRKSASGRMLPAEAEQVHFRTVTIE